MNGRLKICLSLLFMPMLTSATDPGSEWKHADERSRNAVVQVWAQCTSFNWFYPFRSPEQRQGAGSGFFIDTSGKFLTNYHVVRGATSVHVTLPLMGKTPLATEIIGVCPELDVALLTLTRESREQVIAHCGSINALEFGDSDALFETESVLALGFPLGFRTLKSTVGSVAGRDFQSRASLIYITVPINPGNSGGPLLNRAGQVVGINTSGFTDAQNYNYIVPSNEVLIVLPDLHTTKLVRRPDYGVGMNPSTPAHARAQGNPVPAGMYINYVYEDSMEEKAGLKAGDMLYEIEFNGARYQIDQYGDTLVPWRARDKISLAELLVRCRIGDPLVCRVYRNGKKLDLKGTFESAKLLPVRTIYPEYEKDELDYEMFGGLVIMQLRANHLDILAQAQRPILLKEISQYRYPENKSKAALVITCVLPGSVAHLSDCLYAGYLIDTVNGKKVTTLSELRKALLLSVKTGDIAITTKDRPATVLELAQVLDEEPVLSRNFMYPLTDTVKKLRDLFKK